MLGISRERVRQILWRSISRLRENNKSYDDDNDIQINESHQESRKKIEIPHIGDYVLLPKTVQVGKVIGIRMFSVCKKIDLLMRSGLTDTISVDNPSFLILPKSFGEDLYNKEFEAKEIDGIKIGDVIKYKGKNARVCNILFKGGSTRLRVKYKKCFRYMPYDKSINPFINSNGKSSITQERIHHKKSA